MYEESFDDMINSITVEEYMSNFKVCIFPNFRIEQIKELITFYKNNSDLSEVEKYNLEDIEKNLNTAIDYNKFDKHFNNF